MQVELTKEEMQVAIQLFDIAVKSGGLNVAQAAVTLTSKLEGAMQEDLQEDNKIKE